MLGFHCSRLCTTTFRAANKIGDSDKIYTRLGSTYENVRSRKVYDTLYHAGKSSALTLRRVGYLVLWW